MPEFDTRQAQYLSELIMQFGLSELMMQFDIPVDLDHDNITKPIFARYLAAMFDCPVNKAWDRGNQWLRERHQARIAGGF